MDAPEILQAVDAMVPRLAARAGDAEALRRLPDETVREAEAAGYLGMLTPRRFGGAGCDLASFLEATRRLAHGCASSAWTLSFLSLHAWLLCRFDPRVQEELFASGPAPRMPAPLAPTGKAVRTDGGYRVSGRWEWATGIMHAEWVMVTAMDAERGPCFCILPRADVEVVDVWHVAGMAATGSNDVVVRDAFVPEHRTLELWRIKAGTTPGEALHAGSNVGWPLGATLVLVASTPALGAGEGALETFTVRMKEKQMMRGHVVFDWDRAAQIGGKIALGIEPTPADMLRSSGVGFSRTATPRRAPDGTRRARSRRGARSALSP